MTNHQNKQDSLPVPSKNPNGYLGCWKSVPPLLHPNYADSVKNLPSQFRPYSIIDLHIDKNNLGTVTTTRKSLATLVKHNNLQEKVLNLATSC